MALKIVLLDTSAYTAFKRGVPQVVEILRMASTILLPATVLGELLTGFKVGSQTEKNRRELLEFQQSPRVRSVAVTQETAERYAHIYQFLRKSGRPIPTNDLWIGASTMEHGATLLTTDGHFRNLPQLLVEQINVQG
ncbi:MAG: type II toxin-antitoxin system VapC family toxin [Caldilineaceae bacterium]|nr:type II toxin-antitoxin system VapC family toxin [Caldilineaceae bacterium]